MLGSLVQKELLHHLLDFRFISVVALCVVLSVLSVYGGGRNYARQLQEYDAISEANRRVTQGWLEKGNLTEFAWKGHGWSRRPEALSLVVYGLSGTLGQEVNIQYQQPPEFEASPFATDPARALFEVLDLAFIVKVVLSLCVLMFTYDSVCGEKETGTLRLYASFPVPRSTLALAKLVGSTVAVLVPFLFTFLLVCAMLALSPGLGLRGEDWGRIATLVGVFTLYLTVFAAFGLWVSALTHRRMTASLGLLGLWAAWIFVVPNLAVRATRSLAPVEGIYDLEGESRALRRAIRQEEQSQITDYRRRNAGDGFLNFQSLSAAQQQVIREAVRKIETRWDAEFYARLAGIQARQNNQMRRQQRLTTALSALSPLSAVSLVSMDLARTGFVQQERIEDALNVYLIYMARFIREKKAQAEQSRILTDFSMFTYQDRETLRECLSRNAVYILYLGLLTILGFVGAYVCILRYDVR